MCQRCRIFAPTDRRVNSFFPQKCGKAPLRPVEGHRKGAAWAGGLCVERRTEEMTETHKAEQRGGGMAINRTGCRRSLHATIDRRGSRRGATDRCMAPGGAMLLFTTDSAPGHLVEQRPHRAQERPTEYSLGFRPSTGLTPGMPQSGPYPPPGDDTIDSTLSLHWLASHMGTGKVHSLPAQVIMKNRTMWLPIRQKRIIFETHRRSESATEDRPS